MLEIPRRLPPIVYHKWGRVMGIELEKEQRKEALNSLQQYFEKEMEQELGEMQAGFLLEYFLKEIAPLAYNRGVADAQRYFIEKNEDLTGIVYEDEFSYWWELQQKRGGRS